MIKQSKTTYCINNFIISVSIIISLSIKQCKDVNTEIHFDTYIRCGRIKVNIEGKL